MLPPLRLNPASVTVDNVTRLLETLQRNLAQARLTEKRVHAIRVCCKKLRSWIRLLRHRRSKAHWRQADKALRKITHKLASARDRTVLRQSIEKLQTATRSASRQVACRQVLADLDKLAPSVHASKLRPLPRRIVHELLGGKLPSDKAVTRGLQLTHARGLQLARQAFMDGHSARLHDLRRWVKYLAYQLELVTVPTAASEKFRKQLVDLGRTLGEVHDLEVLRHQLSASDASGAAANAQVMAQAKRLEHRLIARAAVVARTVFEL